MPTTLQNKLIKQKLRKNQEYKKLLTSDKASLPLFSSCNGTTEILFTSYKKKLSHQVLKAVGAMGYTYLTEIQARVFNVMFSTEKRPAIKVIAKTGSGKTLAYLIPLVELAISVKADDSIGTIAIVICPTRELALQVYGVLVDLMQFCRQKPALVRGGGVKKDEARLLYYGASIVVSTPGRLLEHLKSTEGFVISNFLSLVIDEADRLFEMGFEREMSEILGVLKNIRPHQTMMFSATDAAGVNRFSSSAFHSIPVTIDISLQHDQATVSQLQQEFILCPSEKRFLALYCLLANLRSEKVMVFLNSRHSILFIGTLLNNMQIEVQCIHGHLTQEQRNTIFNRFNRQNSGVLMCTDIASRGWDIPVVDWIIQYDPPDDPREYIHRVGRTARGGRTGHALVLLRPEEWEFVNFMRAHHVQLSEKIVDWKAALCYHADEIAQSFLLDEPPFSTTHEAIIDPRKSKKPLKRVSGGKIAYKKQYK